MFRNGYVTKPKKNFAATQPPTSKNLRTIFPKWQFSLTLHPPDTCFKQRPGLRGQMTSQR